MSTVRTVLGDVDSADLGVVLPHEHLVNDNTVAFRPAADPRLRRLLDAPVSAGLAWLLADHPYENADNCRLDDLDAIAADLQVFASVGGRTVVDLTPPGIGRDPERLRALSERTGVQVVMGSGWYLQASHPAHLATSTPDELAAELVAEFDAAHDLRPGVIGEIGVSPAFTDDERTALRAACRAQRDVGVPLFVHLPGWLRRAHEVLDVVLDQEGVDPAAVVLCHMDPSGGDPDHQRSVAARGTFLEFDMVGMPFDFPGEGRSPSPAETTAAVVTLVQAGHGSRVLLSHDLFLKAMLSRFGGNGLAYVPVVFADRLRTAGLADDVVAALMTDNPRTLFDGAARKER
ncbi:MULTISPECIES: phosphotriesterase family protein [unclassified Modestobacter]|uniref:phosphotriesterase family protein n=1 Tax=unclassified Modestobacter TaxID=2643866 RepID=UPI0022AAE65A|nr:MULTISPECIES: phosphotriesterase [unclassified Modestobacter]MCZ2810974.1 phosphotriesterase [Modestobacter sp. VKM Ac-2979]MCZ2840487.1 phosphotriesterase [Modestobacter sp. VKM Ac-2980]MCZ2849614.1 phosphotriesterase [Modestobacter sp. VKM Ac-2978]